MRSILKFGLIAALLGALAAVNSVQAVAPSFRPGGKSTSRSGEQIIGELRSIRAVLENADRDYKGHRAAAVHELGVAIHALENHHGMAKHHPTGAPNAGEKGGNEKQEVSDKHLEQAKEHLKHVEMQLTRLPKNEHHMKAEKAIRLAIKELGEALNIK